MARYVGTRIAEKPKKAAPSRGEEAPRRAAASGSRSASSRSRVSRSTQRRKEKLRKRLIRTAVVIVVLVAMYLTVAYSHIPFIEKYRTLYIETAMGTMSHQWLARIIFPKSVVDAVVKNMDKQLSGSMVEESELPSAPPSTAPSARPSAAPGVSPSPEQTAPGLEELLEMFPEIDKSTLPKNLDLVELQISDVASKGIKTTAGDAVWAIDMPNQLMILEVKGDGYVGKLAIVRDSSRVSLAANDLNGQGRKVANFCSKYGAVLAINASAFPDDNGVGNGAEAYGLLISNGKLKHEAVSNGYYIMGGFDYDDNFRMGFGLNTSKLRDAMQFYPIVVLNGSSVVTDVYNGLHPRTLIGQTADKSVLMLVVDGRQVHSLGITLKECGEILLRYGAYNALNMDGGSSSSMVYNGKMITKSSSPQQGGRYLPDAWLVMPPEDTE